MSRAAFAWPIEEDEGRQRLGFERSMGGSLKGPAEVAGMGLVVSMVVRVAATKAAVAALVRALAKEAEKEQRGGKGRIEGGGLDGSGGWGRKADIAAKRRRTRFSDRRTVRAGHWLEMQSE